MINNVKPMAGPGHPFATDNSPHQPELLVPLLALVPPVLACTFPASPYQIMFVNMLQKCNHMVQWLAAQKSGRGRLRPTLNGAGPGWDLCQDAAVNVAADFPQ